MVVLNHYLLLAGILFTIGVTGVMVRRNAIVLLMSVELMMNAGNLALIAFARFQNNQPDLTASAIIAGNSMAMVFIVMTVAAAEVAVGLAILINLHRQRESLDADQMHEMSG